MNVTCTVLLKSQIRFWKQIRKPKSVIFSTSSVHLHSYTNAPHLLSLPTTSHPREFLFSFPLDVDESLILCLFLGRLIRNMGDRQVIEQQHTGDPQLPSSPSNDDMVSCVMALEAALLPCLPARELQAIDRSPHPSHQIDVDRYARDFMEAAKKLQLYFISLQREEKPTKAEMLRKEIALMEEELNIKNELIKKQENLIQEWKKELKDQLDKHKIELDRKNLTPDKKEKEKIKIKSRASLHTFFSVPLNLITRSAVFFRQRFVLSNTTICFMLSLNSRFSGHRLLSIFSFSSLHEE
ncbi:hypothetical protein VNO78_10625 [Psophocarpus tetragonolobus]|uniref:Mediator of RNA polymerase II transcription subunit 28 n=1 Tax=Psophocarpus tetragonolobus TaxID=3891 RepID=A0AAN9XME6_PSOTE